MALSQEQERVRQVERVLSSVEAFLKDTIDFEGSSLMAHLRQRGVLTYAQEDVIKVRTVQAYCTCVDRIGLRPLHDCFVFF